VFGLQRCRLRCRRGGCAGRRPVRLRGSPFRRASRTWPARLGPRAVCPVRRPDTSAVRAVRCGRGRWGPDDHQLPDLLLDRPVRSLVGDS